jgi:hypothetical protein
VRARVKKFEEGSPAEFLVLREKMGLGRYRKSRIRDEEKKRLLFAMALRKMEEKEKDDFILLGPRRRRIKISTGAGPENTFER